MKNMKKLASILLALVMVFALTANAFAAAQEGDMSGGSITINNAINGETYTIYQILYLESYNAETDAYAYKANTDWSEWLNSDAIKGVYVNIDAQGYVTWVEGADTAAFAKLAKAALANKTKAGQAEAGSATVTFENLKLGYYLLDSTLGTLCSLDTTNPAVTIEEKNTAPTIDKEVEEDSSNEYGDKNDADIGQVVNFKTTVNAKKGARNYVVHDKMSAGLTFGSVSSVKVGENALTSGVDYNVVSADLEDGCDFHVVFTQAYLDTITADTAITIEYTATVNENAVIGGVGNPNETWLDYGDSQHTEHDKTVTYTWNFDILKYGNGDENNVLEGAKFVLLNNDKTKVATIVNGKVTGWEDVPAEGAEWPANTILTTDAHGKIEIEGLDADTYNLHETKAPDGYNKLNEDTVVVITTKTDENDEFVLTYELVTAKINNQSGTELPSTGGMGTTIFYVAGSVLALAAIVLLIAKKRMGAKG